MEVYYRKKLPCEEDSEKEWSGSIKNCFRNTVVETSLTLEVLETMIIETESTINSRPLTFVYNNPHIPSTLTPAHFLVGKRLMSLSSTKLSPSHVDIEGNEGADTLA